MTLEYSPARRIVFLGNCQLLALSQLYQRFAPAAADEIINYFAPHEVITANQRCVLEAADLIVAQRLDMPSRLAGGADEMSGLKAVRHFVPLLSGAFLWPYAGTPHPRNESLWFMPAGPYDGEMSDLYLNRMIEKDVPPEDAVAEYLALDIGRARRLDGLRALAIERQHARDAACGYRLADIIARHVQDEKLFRTPHHPERRLTVSLASQLFQHIGAGDQAIAALHGTLRTSPFPRTELPIHPAIARHFQLTYANAETGYAIHAQGRQTFAEFALHYMAFDWNRELEEGIALIGHDLARAITLLTSGLASSPRSAEGWYCLAEAHRLAGDLPAAEAADRHAVTLDPTEARYLESLGKTLTMRGSWDEAASYADRAAMCDPGSAAIHALRAHVAAGRGDFAAAAACAQQAAACDPSDPDILGMFGDVLVRAGRADDGIAMIARAVALAPGKAAVHFALSRALASTGRIAVAIEAAARARVIDPDHPGLPQHIAFLANISS